MNRIINDADLVVEDAVRGYLTAHRNLVAPTDNPRVIRRHLAPRQGAVGVGAGGGSRHEPAFPGYVGDGRFPTEGVVTHKMPLANFQKGIDMMQEGDGSIKIVLIQPAHSLP